MDSIMASFRGWVGQLIKGVCGLQTLHGHTFIPCILNPDAMVIDLGTNRGAFASAIRRRFGCRVLGAEANPQLVKQVREDGVDVRHVAISNDTGIAKFAVSHNSEASSIFEAIAQAGGVAAIIDVPTQCLDSFLNDNGVAHVALLKMDIEGSEIAVVDGIASVSTRIDQISIEFHDFIDPTQAADVSRCMNQLKRLGFVLINPTVPQHVDCLFVNAQVFRGVLGKWLRLRLAVMQVFFQVRGLFRPRSVHYVGQP